MLIWVVKPDWMESCPRNEPLGSRMWGMAVIDVARVVLSLGRTIPWAEGSRLCKWRQPSEMAMDCSHCLAVDVLAQAASSSDHTGFPSTVDCSLELWAGTNLSPLNCFCGRILSEQQEKKMKTMFNLEAVLAVFNLTSGGGKQGWCIDMHYLILCVWVIFIF